jgi:triosephosphate isomerase
MNMRKKIVAGNWKMNVSRSEAKQLLNALIKAQDSFPNVEVIVFPSFVHLALTQEILTGSLIQYGAQNLYTGAAGAFTGEVSGPMCKDYGCHYVLIGHSERRAIFHEDLDLVAQKLEAALAFDLAPVLCVGETLEQRERGETEKIIAEQLSSVINVAGIDALQRAIIAYEPVWAIGTGLTATPDVAEEVHAFIRAYLVKENLEVGESMRILYGGSVKADNAKDLFAMPNIDGGLVGGASLQAIGFIEICRAAE